MKNRKFGQIFDPGEHSQSGRAARRAAEAEARKNGQGKSIPALKAEIRRNKQRQAKRK